MYPHSDALLVAPLDLNATTLPSPNQLKRKIIIKHKKLTASDGGELTLDLPAPVPSTAEPTEGTDIASFVMDLSNSIKNGYLFMQDPIDKVGMAGGRGLWKHIGTWLGFICGCGLFRCGRGITLC